MNSSFRNVASDFGVLKGLSEASLAYIEQSANQQDLAAGDYLFLEGEAADAFYLVVSGAVDLLSTDILKGEVSVGRAMTGNLVGAIPLVLNRGEPRHHHAARAVTDTRVVRIEKSLVGVLAKNDPGAFESIRAESLNALLSSAPRNHLIDLVRDPIHRVAHIEAPVFRDKERLFSEGETANAAYILLTGSVKIMKASAPGEEKMLARVKPGQLFGEAGFDDDERRKASAYSEGTTCLLKIGSGDYKALLSDSYELRRFIDLQKNLYRTTEPRKAFPPALRNMLMSNRIAFASVVSALMFAMPTIYFGQAWVEDRMAESHAETAAVQAVEAAQRVETRFESFDKAFTTYADRLEGSAELPEQPSMHKSETIVYLPDTSEQYTLPVSRHLNSVIYRIKSDALGGKPLPGFFPVTIGEDGVTWFRQEVIKGEDGTPNGLVVGEFDLLGAADLRHGGVLTDRNIFGASPEIDGDEAFQSFISSLESGRGVLPAGEEFVSGTASLQLGEASMTLFEWKMSSSLSAALDTVFLLMISGALMAIVGATLAARVWSRWILSPIEDMTFSLRRLSEGQRGIQVPYAGRGNEISRMAAAIDALQSHFTEQEDIVTDRMVEQQNKIETQERIRREITEFHGQLESIIAEVVESIKTVNTVSEDMLTGSSRASDGVQNILQLFESTQESVTKVDKLSHDLKAATDHIKAQTDASDASLRSALDRAEAATDKMDMLNRAVSGIGTIAETIDGISEQTRMLALNAHIEAAKAGPSGNGFAVVAQEVRNLSDKTNEATADIGTKVADIQREAEEVMLFMGSFRKDVGAMKNEQDHIREAVQSQSAATDNITDEVQNATEHADRVSDDLDGISRLIRSSEDGAKDLSESANSVDERAAKLAQVVKDFLNFISKSP